MRKYRVEYRTFVRDFWGIGGYYSHKGEVEASSKAGVKRWLEENVENFRYLDSAEPVE